MKGGGFDKEYNTLGNETGGGEDEGQSLSDVPVL